MTRREGSRATSMPIPLSKAVQSCQEREFSPDESRLGLIFIPSRLRGMLVKERWCWRNW